MALKIKPDEPTRIFREEPLTIVYRRWRCGAVRCDGEMRPTGVSYASMPPQYPHRCDNCGREESASVTYPRVAYLPIEALEPA